MGSLQNWVQFDVRKSKNQEVFPGGISWHFSMPYIAPENSSPKEHVGKREHPVYAFALTV